MTFLKIAKFAAKSLSTAAVSEVVNNIIVATTPEIQNTTQRVMTRIGSFVISAYIGDQIGTYISREWDQLFAEIKKAQAAAASTDEEAESVETE